MLFDIHILVGNANNLYCVFNHPVKYNVTAFPKTTIAFFYFISCSPQHWVACQPTHPFAKLQCVLVSLSFAPFLNWVFTYVSNIDFCIRRENVRFMRYLTVSSAKNASPSTPSPLSSCSSPAPSFACNLSSFICWYS